MKWMVITEVFDEATGEFASDGIEFQNGVIKGESLDVTIWQLNWGLRRRARMKVEEVINYAFDRIELDKFSEYAEMEERYRERREQDIVFAIMSEQVRIASELIGLLDDKVISEITGISINHLNCMKN